MDATGSGDVRPKVDCARRAVDASAARVSAASTHVDVLIVGAGLSGIGAAWHVQQLLPGRSYAILEARDAIGGTWDLFRYPGVRSDSDMHTLGYGFRPWTGAQAIAAGGDILDYIRETAREGGIDRHVRFGRRVTSARWCSDAARWTVEAVRGDGTPELFTCRWLHMCAGYYDYEAGHAPDFADADSFGGPIVHPQVWPEGLDVAGQHVAVIGSGATAVTLVPALAARAAHVTMVQRSPSYILSLPTRDRAAAALRRLLPERAALKLIRWRNIVLGQIFYRYARAWPGAAGRALVMAAAAELPGVDAGRHLTPIYRPWDQRLCLVPDGDLFAAIRAGRASIVTGAVERFTPDGLRLASGEVVRADLIVTATGLSVRLLGGAALAVDGQPVEPASRMIYKGLMFAGIPNLSFAFGYTNASWTLKADLGAAFLCRLLARMARKGARIAVPRADPDMAERPFVDFTSSYIERARDRLPKQGARAPWRLHQNYTLDLLMLRFGRLEDGVLELG